MAAKKITRTTKGLQNMLMDEMDDYINGLNTEKRMMTISKTTTAICRILVVELAARKMLERVNMGSDKPKSVTDLNADLSVPLGG